MSIPDHVKEALAAEAVMLKNNEAFQNAMTMLRSDALESLVRTPATDVEAIRDLQARVWVVDELRGCVESFIRQGKPRKAPGIV